ncbi:GRAM domain-containing protein 2B isoform X1 [Lates calcarifer]|uniref:GRAM domain-containing protein 2B isoform X1 n=1 Tax=Lates calcarifer TaxID=8187 RepID=A0AAJ8BE20_LATCA|nr:GRAM domain-containing protein 2B isoform X1 [Lates calcarifer]XP_050930835.1 GRAM domain-containing protein 2B isoform X1 [Lates calcarifer]
MEYYNTDDLFHFKRRNTMSKLSCALSNSAGHHRSDLENVVEERQRNGRMISEALQAADQEQRESSGRRKPALVRSKTFDHSLLTQVQTDSEAKIERKKSHYSQLSKSNCQYHKIFKEISKEEQLRQSYTCALQKDILYQGRMFVSDHWICFHSKVFGKDTKIAIPVVSITHIKKTKTAILVPNALVIATGNDRYVFVSLLSRDNTYKFLMSVCLHLEEKSPCSSPVPSSAENSFRGQRSPLTPRFPLSFSGDFSDLDGAVRQRRQEMEESSSSDSQTPDYDKIAEFPVPPFLDVLTHTDRAAPPEHPDQHKVKNQHQNQQSSDHKQHETQHTGSEVMVDSRTLKPVSLNTLLFVYLFLVCVLVLSSCYLAFKIFSLEQMLTTLGSVTEFTQENDFLRGGADVNTELFSELLTINLMKLEKVQKNLQRLLDEAA